MSSDNLLEMAIIAFIVIGILVAVWKGGAKNPVGTGSIDRKLGAVGTELAAIKTSIDGELAGVKTKVGAIEDRIEEIERATASAADIRRLEKAVDKLAKTLPDIENRQRALSDKIGEEGKQIAAIGANVVSIEKQVGLIYSVLVPKGMEK
jgi:predicted  nucleic acid-binding Zn-ribbon protein